MINDSKPGLMDQVVVIGDSLAIPGKESFSSGHGSQSASGEIRATVCGILRPQGSFITVDPFLTRYKPEKGHVVIGRIVEVAQGSWRVDISCDRHARLELSSVDLPASIQRRRTAADELNMRNFLVETDLISAEITKADQGWPAELYAGSSRLGTFQKLAYGKLKKGRVVKVKPYLLKMKKHVHVFHAKECQVRIIFPCNGRVWIGDANQGDEVEQELSIGTREVICRLANAVRAMNAAGVLIWFERVVEVFDKSLSSATTIREMLDSRFEHQVSQSSWNKSKRSS